MRTIHDVLDTIKKVKNIGSDYKLAMYVGLGDSNLRNYRHGRSFPDAKTCQKLAAALGENPGLLIVEMQAQREKDQETRALWETIAKRLQNGFANVQMMGLIAIGLIAACALFHWAALYFAVNTVVQSVYYVKSKWPRLTRLCMKIVKLCKVAFRQRQKAIYVSTCKG